MQQAVVSSLENILVPRDGDAGYDLVASSYPKIVGIKTIHGSPLYSYINYIEYKVDLKISPPKGFFSLVFPRSSLSKYQLSLCNSVGVIDNGYRGEIIVRFNYLFSPDNLYSYEPNPMFRQTHFAVEVDQSKIYQKGDKIAQLLFFPYYKFNVNDGSLGETDRGEGGFGSTDGEKS